MYFFFLYTKFDCDLQKLNFESYVHKICLAKLVVRTFLWVFFMYYKERKKLHEPHGVELIASLLVRPRRKGEKEQQLGTKNRKIEVKFKQRHDSLIS